MARWHAITDLRVPSPLPSLQVFKGSVHEVVYCNLRRSLCYPLYRHWQLAQAVLQDTRDLFHLGNYASTKHTSVGSMMYWTILSQETFVLPAAKKLSLWDLSL